MSEIHKDYYSTREAAKLLGVAVSTIQVWTNNGLLKAWVTGGGHRRISQQSVKEMLGEKKESSIITGADEPCSVVIVEDSAQQTRLYKKHFDVANIKANVYTATDGYEGLVKIGQMLPEIIITDLKMPNMDGFRMIETINTIDELQHSLIIVISGLSDREIEESGGLPQGVHFFRKPVDFEQVTKLIGSRVQATAA